jgi:hypothetical protein
MIHRVVEQAMAMRVTPIRSTARSETSGQDGRHPAEILRGAPVGRVICGWMELDALRSKKPKTHCFQWVLLDLIGCGDRI